MNSSKKYIVQFEHGKQSNDDICKFNSFWISFNCFFNEFEKKSIERVKINNLKKNNNLINTFLKINNNKRIKFNNYINCRSNKGVKNLLKNKIIEYKNIDNFGEFLEIIYTIRNNQFHGGKKWDEENDLFLLIETNIVFEDFLEKLYFF